MSASSLKHPCAETCSGYRQAREETVRDAVQLVMNLFFALRHNKYEPKMKDLVKLARRIQRLR